MRTHLISLLCFACLLSNASATSLPEIRLSFRNNVPKCVSPTALTSFVRARNRRVFPRFGNAKHLSAVAKLYRSIGTCVQIVGGKCHGVRWDFAYFQMLIETNYLTFRAPDGEPGSIRESDHNFAGIGATTAGKPGEQFKDMKSGILAHLQHVLMYSGEEVVDPVALRTRAVTSYVVPKMTGLGRPVTFADLAVVWTGNETNAYAEDILQTAITFKHLYCSEFVDVP
jgi:hypothetical protein